MPSSSRIRASRKAAACKREIPLESSKFSVELAVQIPAKNAMEWSFKL
jgi:hypothetical protein